MEETIMTPPSPGEYKAPAPAVDATHRASSCFYGMLSILQLPLAQFVASRRAQTPKLPPEVESQRVRLAKAGLRVQLSFVRDHWATHFSSVLPATVLADVRSLLQVQQQVLYTAATTHNAYQSGMMAAERLLGVVGASADALQQADMLKTLLDVDSIDHRPVASMASVQLSMDGVSTGNRRMAYLHLAKQIMAANEQDNGVDTVDVAAYEKAIELLDAALELAATPNQRCRIFAMRSECKVYCGHKELASEDAEAALATQIALTKHTAMKLVGVFKAVERWTDVARVCDSALRGDPTDEELRQEKALALENAEKEAASVAGITMDEPAQDGAVEAPVDREEVPALIAEIRNDAVADDIEGDEESGEEDHLIDEGVATHCEAPDLSVEAPLVPEDQLDEAPLFIGAADGAVSPSKLVVHQQTVAANEDEDNGSAPSYLVALLHEDTQLEKKTRQTIKRDSKELRTAKLCVELHEYEEAIFWIDKEILRTKKKKKPHDQATLYVCRAQCHFELKDFVSAVEDARMASSIDTTIAKAYHWASEALLRLGRLSEAHSACSAGRKVDKSNEALKVLEKEISRRSLAAHTSRVGAMRTPTASIASSIKEEDDFRTDQDPVELPPWKTAVHIGLGFVQKKNLTAAERAFTEAWNLVANEDDMVDAKVNVLGHRTRCRLSMKQYELAVSDAGQGLLVKPDWVEGHRMICKGFMGLERWRDALKECDIVLREAPQDADFGSFRAEIKRKLPSLACEPTVATKNAPWYPQMQASIHAGLLHVEHDRYVDGEACFTKALSVLKKFKGSASDTAMVQSRIKIFGHRARCRLAMENWQGAAEDARAGIQFEAHWIEGYRLLCRALMGSSQWPKALDACHNVLLYAPQDVAFAQLKTQLEQKCAEVSAASVQGSDGESVASHENSSGNESLSGSSEEDEQSSEHDTASEPTNGQAVLEPLDLDTGCHEVDKAKLVEAASGGSIVAQRYLAAERLLTEAQEMAMLRGDLKLAFEDFRDALQLWAELDFPKGMGWIWGDAGWDNSIAWGGPMLYYYVQAMKREWELSTYSAERQFWQLAVESSPENPELHMTLAWVLYRGKEINAALEHTEKALALVESSRDTLMSTSSLLYLRACCTETEVASSEVENVILATELSKREDRLLEYVQHSPVDDEWMPHALYWLGVLSLSKGDYTRAKQFHALARESEARHGELGGVFHPFDENRRTDKRTLEEAVEGRLAVVGTSAGTDVGVMKCGWCHDEAIPVDRYMSHKANECSQLPVCPVAWM